MAKFFPAPPSPPSNASTPWKHVKRAARRYWLHATAVSVAAALLATPESAQTAMSAMTTGFLDAFGWLVLLASTGAVLVCLIVAVGRSGAYRLGGPNAKPEFSRTAWLMMLFAAGMGAGLVFWGAAEPLIHTIAPPPSGPADSHQTASGSATAARDAMTITLLHWALHPWAIYTIGAIAVGVFGFSRGGALRPSAGLNAFGFLGRIIDLIALFAVTFGIVASLGQGVIQISAGISELTSGSVVGGSLTGLVVLGSLLVFYSASVTTGLQRGIKWLSEANLILAISLAIFVLALGPTLLILEVALTALGDYLRQLPTLSISLREGDAAQQWMADWTLVYFLWWIAWIPFVGVFIARISYGRSIRELVLGVLLAPSLFTLLWFGVMGGTALDLQISQGVDLGVSNFDTAPQSIYALLAQYPLTQITQVLAAILVFIFLATSADSGSYVLAMLSDRGQQTPPVWERLFWGAVLAALTAGALLTGEGQLMMRTLAMAGGVPMLFVMIGMAIVLVRSFRGGASASPHIAAPVATTGPQFDQPSDKPAAPPHYSADE